MSRSIPGSALDPAWLKTHLPRYLWHEGETPERITGLKISYSRQSSSGIKALYELALQGPDQRVFERVYAGYQVSAEALAGEYEDMRKRALRLPGTGRAVAVIPEERLVLLAFPNDRRMRPLTADELVAWLDARAATLAPNGANGHTWRIAEAKIDVLRYIPESRFTVRCRGTLRAADGSTRGFAVIAKQFKTKRRAKALYRSLVALERSAGGTLLRVPRALSFDEDLGLIVMEELSGRELKRALDGVDLGQAFRGVGGLVASLHQSTHRVRRTVTVREELREAGREARTISERLPALRPRLKGCLDAIRAMEGMDAVPKVLLHGACRLKHVFIQETADLAFVDLDGLAMGPAAYDLGNFLSSLYYLEAQGLLTPAVRQSAGRHFLEGYAAAARSAVPTAAVLWFLALLLISKQASKYVRHLHEDCADKATRMIALAEATIERHGAVGEMPLEAACEALPRS